MTNTKKIANISVAAVLALGVMTLGAIAYQQKIQADTILPGYATSHLNMHITVPTAQTVRIKAVYTPTNGSKRFYYKERDFDLGSPGLNTIDWYIRKIPGGDYNVTVTSLSGQFSPSYAATTLQTDQLNDTGKFDLFLGDPPTPTPTPTPEPTVSQTTDTSTDTINGTPPVPGDVNTSSITGA